MPWTSRSGESSGAFESPTAPSGSLQVMVLDYPTPVPASLVASATWSSGLIFGDGFPKVTVGVLMDHAGTLIIHRFLDAAGTIERPIVTTPIVANTALIVDVTDGLPYVTSSIEIDNAVGATGNISKFVWILSN
jgi:hypothetical protein